MSLLKYIKEYCKANNIYITNFLKSRNINRQLLHNKTNCNSLNVLLKLDDILNDKKEFREMVCKRIRLKLRLFNEVDVENIPNEALFEIYEILKHYKEL